ncbi:MAG: outer membrane beta-barrel protein, partial [Mariniphaga sp.]|nr:outer membrane beta-barrel protein [Mariniphaga sp.]
LSVGADYKLTDAFSAQLSYTSYFDKNVNWGNNIYSQERTIDGNSWELALGLQYSLSDNFAVSIGALRMGTGASEQYQSDFSYSNSTYTGALGVEWKLSDNITLDLGFMATNYESVDKGFTSENFGSYSENYDKATYGFAFGIAYSIF